MAKRPPKPEGQAPNPRFRTTNEDRSFNRAVEASRRLTTQIDFHYEPKQLVEMDDRAIAVLKAAHVESMLRLAVRFFVHVREEEERDMFKSEGPLGTFSRSITMGYALNVFGPKTKRNLEITRLIRNVFAHSTRIVTFDTYEIKELCSFYTFKLNGSSDKQNAEEARIRNHLNENI